MNDQQIKEAVLLKIQGDSSAMKSLDEALRSESQEERHRVRQIILDLYEAHAAAILAKDRTYPMTYDDLVDERQAFAAVENRARRQAYEQETAKTDRVSGPADASVIALKVADKAARDLDRARPFLRRAEWRTTPMYRNWDLELIEAAYGDNVAITRSRYGYRVMATPNMQCLDVDFSMAYCVEAQRKQAIVDLKMWIARHSGQIWKVYETAKGLRFIRVDSAAAPDEQYIEMAKAITNADSHYAELCAEQGAYRLRVSAKPWRIGSTYPRWNVYWGHVDSDWNDKFDLAVENANYDKLAGGYRVARVAADWEMNVISDAPSALKTALELHDTLTGASYEMAGANSLKDEEWTPDEIHRGDASDIICHDPSLPIVVAFNHVYRSTGICPPLIWHFLGDSTRALRVMEGEKMEEYARREWNTQRELCQRWCGTRIPTFDAAVKVWEGEQIASYDHYPRPKVFSDAHLSLKLRQKATEPNGAPAPANDADEDYFSQLANIEH